MNETIVITMPVWFYWYLIVWLAIQSAHVTVKLVNEYLRYRINKQS